VTTPRALLYGTLAVGVLDGADAAVFFGLRGVSPVRVFQAIASGVLGRPAFAGGLGTAALGVTLHFFIAFAIVATYLAASRRIPILVRRPIACGILYGIGVYLMMNLVVVPLSAAATGLPSWPVILNGVLIHMFGVGLPSSLFARAACAEPKPSARVES
jgi:hypothetical protein